MGIPKVSVIVPVYNVERYLSRCMDSLLNQTLKDIEIVLVDDGSPDRSPEVCDEYARNDSRIKVIHKMNAGLGFARNSGLEIASGEYVAFVDSDDYVDVSMYQMLYMEAETNNCNLVLCNFNRILANGDLVSVIEQKVASLFTGSAVCELLMGMIGSDPSSSMDRKYSMSVWRGLYSRSLISNNKIKFASERDIVSEDIIFHIDLFSHLDRAAYIPFCGYNYCENELSLSRSYRPDRFQKTKNLRYAMVIACAKYFPSMQYEFKLRIERMFLGYIRSMLLTYDYQLDEVEFICQDETLASVLRGYPYLKLPIPYALFALLLRLKLGGIVYFILRTRRKWRG